MRRLIIFCFIISVLQLQSCFTTSAYRSFGGYYFQNYSKDKNYYVQKMDGFRQSRPDLMLDSSFVNRHFKKGFYLAVPEKKRIFSEGLEYPLFPHINQYGLHSWFIKSPDQIHIYEVGLYNCYFDKPKYNSCTLDLYRIFTIEEGAIKWVDLANNDTKEYKERRKEYLNKFEAEILPFLKTNFVIK